MPTPDRLIAVDWSGDKGPGQRKKIWAGVWTRKPGTLTSGSITLEGGRSRDELTAWLLSLARETPSMVVGIDCCFSYPAWFLTEHHCATVFEFWQHVAAGHGERWLARDCPDARFWGSRGSLRTGKRPLEFCGDQLHTSMRQTDMDNKILPFAEGGDPDRAAKMRGITAKSPFQIGGSGSVGTGTLRAIPHILHLREHGFRVWPFDAASLTAPHPRPLLVEMYTRLLTGPVAKSNALARKAYLAERRKQDPLYATLTRRVLTHALASEDAFDALICVVEMLRHQTEFAPLRATQNPQLQLEGITWRPNVTNVIERTHPSIERG